MGKNCDAEDLNVQSILLHMLDWFNKFCDMYNLRYYMIGGTMLGAIRHRGFIPWDDDIDIGMPRNDYERFLNLIAEQKQSDCQYVVEIASNTTPEFIYPYAKMYNTQTTLIEKARRVIRRGIYIDIFPLDGIGHSIEESKLLYTPILKKLQLLTLINLSISSHRSIYKNLLVLLSRLIPRFIISTYILIVKIEKACKKYSFDNSEVVGNLVGAWGYKELMPKEYFGEPKKYQFESLSIFGVANPDSYLKALYGDYMKLPPEEKRKSHHDYLYRNLNEQYDNLVTN